MKAMRGWLVVMLGSCAVLGLLAVLRPARSAPAAHAAASLDVAIGKVTAHDATIKWPTWQKSRAAITVTLISFTATALPGLPEVYVQWETATEIDTAGFYVARSPNATGPWMRVSNFIPAEGDAVTGALYDWIDETAILNHRYYYRLEVINTDATVDYYGPIFVTTGEHVILSEVLYDPTGADNGLEWVELFNPTSNTIDLNDYSLSNGGTTYLYSVVQLTGTLPPSSCWVIGGPTSNITNYSPIFDQSIDFNPDFQNGATPADGIALFDVKAISITTSTIPIDAVIYGTANTSNLIDETGVASPPDVAVAASGKSNERTDITGTWRVQVAPTPNNCTVLTTTVEPPPPPPPLTPPGSVLISALHFDARGSGQGDEGFRLTNVSTQPITLSNWAALKSPSPGEINLTVTLQPDQSIWIAKTAITFTQQFGFKPDYKYTADDDVSVPTLTVKSVPAFGDSGRLVLREGVTNTIDAIIWGTTTLTDTHWTGSNVQRYGDGNVSTSGQIIYRKLDEATGKIVADTNTALDWANDRSDPVSGRKAQYPGWDLDQFWQTAKVTQTATLTVAIAPDNAYRVISDVLGAAQSSIKMELHTFDNLGLLNVVTRTIGRGVAVTILLEGGPVGGIDDQELWVCQQIESAGGQCWFMINDSGKDIHDRYDYIHSKMIVVDDRIVAIGSENLSPRSLTYDNPADGTRGHRGAYLVTDASGVVLRALEIWQADFDPINQRDIYRWSITDTKYGLPPIGFAPNDSIEVSGYRIRYPQPLVVTGAFPFELLTAPESALRAGDSLLSWINRSGAGDTIDVEQLDEPPHWGDSASTPIDDPNVRLQALIDAASRGAKVRLLLDRYFDDPLKLTSNAATVQYIESLRAISPTLHDNLEARLGDPAMHGLHNKLFLFNVGGRQAVHVGSLNGTETSNKVNREVALQVESSAAYDYLRAMFGYDWDFQPRALLPIVFYNYIAPPDHLLISKVFYLGSTSVVTGSEWVQIYNPTPITVSLTGYKLGDQALPGSTGFTVDGMWQFPLGSSLGPGQVFNVATTGRGFFDKYGRPPHFAFFTSDVPVPLMSPYLQYTLNISFSLANTGDEVLLLGAVDQLIDGVAWKSLVGGADTLPGNVSCIALDPAQYPFPIPNPFIARAPLWKDTDNCPADFVIDPSALP